MKALCIIISVLMCLPFLAHAGHGSFRGDESLVWERCCLAYVRVEAAEGLGHIRAKLRPIARLAGNLDFGDAIVIETEVRRGSQSMINADPVPGMYALAVIFDVRSQDVRIPSKYCIFTDNVFFMPGFSGFVPVVGDPTPLMEKILKVLKEIQETSANGGDIRPIIEAFQKNFEDAGGVSPK